MSLTIFYGLLTLAPLALGVALAALGLARRATPVVGVALAVAGVILPVVGLAWMAAEVSAGYPLEIALWGGPATWLAIYARADALSVYTGLGIAALVTPLLLWVAWRAAPPDSAETPEPEAVEPEAVADATDAADAESAAPAGAGSRSMGRWQWTGVALTLALESFLLSLVFAENIAWLLLTWLLVIGASWALGELGSDAQSLDWKSLTLMAAPPVVWFITTMLIAGPAGARRLIDLTGGTKFPIGHLFVMTLAVAVAAGAWPALGWMRKRASITAPVGLGAAALAVMPAALFVGARTFSIAQTVSSEWPAFTIAKPPITIGVSLAALGAVTALFAGLLALGRRDGRGLLASSALAVAGWGLLSLGIGAPLAGLGLILLLTTSTLGLGAMLAALVASGAVTADIEPDSAGPHIFGEPARPATLFAWVVGAATVVGLPLFAGFAPMQIISAAALPGPRVVIPLVGLAWGGSTLLLIGLLRATAPAFTSPVTALAVEGVDATEPGPETGASEDSEDGEDEEKEDALATPVSGPDLRAADLPAVALGTLALIVGIAPAALLTIESIPAAEAFLQVGALDGATQAQAAGYTAGAGQWLSTTVVVTIALVAVAMAVIRWRLPRATRPAAIYLSGQFAEEPQDGEGEVEELAGLPEPVDAWDDLRSTLRSGWLTPGTGWLGLEDEAEDEAALEEGAEDEADEDQDEDQGEPEPNVEAEAVEEPAPAPAPAASKPDADDQGARKARSAKRGER